MEAVDLVRRERSARFDDISSELIAHAFGAAGITGLDLLNGRGGCAPVALHQDLLIEVADLCLASAM
jgi:hypothetical protein